MRDAAILGLLLGCGLRRAEAVELNVADVVGTNGAAGKGRGVTTLTVRGKGRKTRSVPVAGGAALALADWLHLRGDAPGALFWRVLKSGRMVAARISEQAVYDLLSRRAAQAGVAPPPTPHDCRRTYISNLLDRNDIAVVSRLAGHANVSATARYDRRGEEAAQAAAKTLHIPYTSKK